MVASASSVVHRGDSLSDDDHHTLAYLVAKGYGAKMIAENLYISPHAVRYRMAKLYRRAGIPQHHGHTWMRIALVRWTIEMGWNK